MRDAPGLVGRPFLFATVLTTVAGFLDAAGYAELSHLYVSFMSGNSTHLGMALAAASWSSVLAVLVIVAAFVLGAGLGSWLADVSGARLLRTILTAELAMLLAAIAISCAFGSRTALVLVTVAMGMQNTMHQSIAGADIGRSFITGTLFNLGQAISRRLRNRGVAGAIASNFVSWLAFVFGAALGTLSLSWLGLTVSLSVCAGTILVLLLSSRMTPALQRNAVGHTKV